MFVVFPSVEAAQVDTARDRGLAWLTTHQKADGSWRSAPGTELVVTATAVEAFANAGLKNLSYSYARGVAWLNNASAPSVDSLARQIVALVGAQVNVTLLQQTLLQRRNSVQAWGAYEGFETSFPDTPLALRAMRMVGPYAELGTGLCVILVGQKTSNPPDSTVDGSWSHILPPTGAPLSATSSSILATTANILEIAAIKAATGWPSITCQTPTNTITYDLQASIDSAINWLLIQRRKGDDGFGDGSVSTVFETALVYPVLSLRPSDQAAKDAALNYLITRQNGDGSWNGDALQTAFVLKALPPGASYVDADKDGLPDSIESILGTDPNAADSRVVVNVDCALGSLQDTVDHVARGEIIFVTGACNENIVARNDKQRIALFGGGTATIHGPSSSSPTVNIRGKGIQIKGFTITGGSSGIEVNRGSNAVIEGNTIENTGGNGLAVNQLAVAVIIGNTIQNNPGAGIFVSENSTARIGFNSDSQTAASQNTINTIEGNGVGIVISNSSSARIVGNTISSNSGDGINVLRDSQADIASNIIESNGGDGIEIAENSVAQLGEDSGTSIYESPNTTTTTSPNTGVGVRCTTGGVADGRLGTLSGNSGAKSFSANCIDSLL